MALLQDLQAIILPKGRGTRNGTTYTPTFNPRQEILTAPTYRQHLDDLFNTRQASDSRTLIGELVNHDSDVSAAVHSYLTISGSAQMVLKAYNAEGQLDLEGLTRAYSILHNITSTYDYTTGYSRKRTLEELCDELRYMILLRGMFGIELVLDKAYVPSDIRLPDPSTIEWREKTPGVFNPVQKPRGSNEIIDLNIPTFFTANFHQSPLSPYTYSPFVSAINTVAARQDVINELYRIMQVVGYPRLDVEVLEDVLLQHQPPAFKSDISKSRAFVESELAKIRGTVAGLTARDAFIHSNAISAKIINDKNPSAGLQIEKVIEVLDNQNQAALKVMPAVVGKGSNGQTASTESRLFALSADALNRTVANGLSKLLTFAVRLAGFQGHVVASFVPVELRPTLELEPQKTMKASRLRQDLSLGLITDDEYHYEVYGRPAPDGAPLLSGTGFLEAANQQIDVEGISPNTDSLGRGLAPEGSQNERSNQTRAGEVQQ